MSVYQPPFQLTHRMTALVADVAEQLGAWRMAGALVPELRRDNRIRTLQASLTIEQNAQARVETEVRTRVEPESGTPRRILALLRERPSPVGAEVAVAIDRARSTMERAPARLQAEGRLRHVGPKKAGRWEVP